MTPRVIPPGSAIGVLGGGQLGRMFAMAARRMGYRVHTLAPEHDTPTGQIADVERLFEAGTSRFGTVVEELEKQGAVFVEELDDRGIIYIRHGEPEEIISTASVDIRPNTGGQLGSCAFGSTRTSSVT